VTPGKKKPQEPKTEQGNEQPLKPGRLVPSPKRGAIPTPRAEIDQAKPYVPEPASSEDVTPK